MADPRRDAAIVADYLTPMSLRAVGAKWGLSQKGVRLALHRRGQPLRSRGCRTAPPSRQTLLKRLLEHERSVDQLEGWLSPEQMAELRRINAETRRILRSYRKRSRASAG